jgi:hypothetical protein
MANIKILLQTAHVSLAQRRISRRAAPAMASQVWRRKNRRRRSGGKQEQEGTCSQALSLSSPTPIPLFLSLPLPRALSRARSRARSFSLSLSRARALSLALALMRRSFQMYCKYAHTQAHTQTHTKHTFPLLLTLTAHFSSQPLLFVSQLAYIRCGSQETVRFLRMPDPTMPLRPQRPQNNISKVQKGEESSSRNKRCQMEL